MRLSGRPRVSCTGVPQKWDISDFIRHIDGHFRGGICFRKGVNTVLIFDQIHVSEFDKTANRGIQIDSCHHAGILCSITDGIQTAETHADQSCLFCKAERNQKIMEFTEYDLVRFVPMAGCMDMHVMITGFQQGWDPGTDDKCSGPFHAPCPGVAFHCLFGFDDPGFSAFEFKDMALIADPFVNFFIGKRKIHDIILRLF